MKFVMFYYLLLIILFLNGCDSNKIEREREELNNDIDRSEYVKDGALIAASYKVSENKRIYFSQGNLQYNAGDGKSHATKTGTGRGTWRFAENQFDSFGDGTSQFFEYEDSEKIREKSKKNGICHYQNSDNSKIDSTYNGWIDLFGWATSGWNSGANACQPWSISENYEDYHSSGVSNDLRNEYENSDWGIYNAISNGSNEPGTWRTLTSNEWNYLFRNNQWTLGVIEEKLCFLLIPENFEYSDSIGLKIISDSFDLSEGYVNNISESLYLKNQSTKELYKNIYSYNVFTKEQFNKLEREGVVALPCGGYRYGKRVGRIQVGYYWSSDTDSEYLSFGFSFGPDFVSSIESNELYKGQSVRLVKDLKSDDTMTISMNNSTVDNNSDKKSEKKHKREGAIVAASYKISDTKRVYFSIGNLQYNAENGKTHLTKMGNEQGCWRFAEKQYEYIAEENQNISSNYNGWIDLFGWGTSGWNSGAKAFHPWSSWDLPSGYSPGSKSFHNLNLGYSNSDWGVYNSISNGGGEPENWRTLTSDEWKYLIQNNKWTMGSVKDKDKTYLCFMLIPEDFEAPEGLNMVQLSDCYDLTKGNVLGISENIYSKNVYTAKQFEQLEKVGVVALPCGGYRNGKVYQNDGLCGCYWSSTAYNSYYAYEFFFNSKIVVPCYNDYRHYGCSVRLVQDLARNPATPTTHSAKD